MNLNEGVHVASIAKVRDEDDNESDENEGINNVSENDEYTE